MYKYTHFENKSSLGEAQANAKRKGEAWLSLSTPPLASGATAQTGLASLPSAWVISQSGRPCVLLPEEGHQ